MSNKLTHLEEFEIVSYKDKEYKIRKLTSIGIDVAHHRISTIYKIISYDKFNNKHTYICNNSLGISPWKDKKVKYWCDAKDITINNKSEFNTDSIEIIELLPQFDNCEKRHQRILNDIKKYYIELLNAEDGDNICRLFNRNKNKINQEIKKHILDESNLAIRETVHKLDDEFNNLSNKNPYDRYNLFKIGWNIWKSYSYGLSQQSRYRIFKQFANIMKWDDEILIALIKYYELYYLADKANRKVPIQDKEHISDWINGLWDKLSIDKIAKDIKKKSYNKSLKTLKNMSY